MPVGVGFGIRDAAAARTVATFADAVVIGSRIVQEVETSPKDKLIENISTFLKEIRTAMDRK